MYISFYSNGAFWDDSNFVYECVPFLVMDYFLQEKIKKFKKYLDFQIFFFIFVKNKFNKNN